MHADGEFRRSRWLPSAHLETIAAALRRYPQAPYAREIIQTREKDEVALDYIAGRADRPLLVLLHGLEGCSQSYTLRALAHGFRRLEWTVAVPHFRGCGGHRNRLPRAYHAADGGEVEWMLSYCRAYFPGSAVFAAGISLGGSALIHCLAGGGFASAAATISTPFNLTACVKRLDSGFNRRVYARHFLKTLRPKIVDKARRFPSICDLKKLKAIRTIGEFDALYTAPVHGFADAAAYWRQASTADLLKKVASPLLCINALNDPLIPADTLPAAAGAAVRFCRPRHGGHGAFIGTPRDWLFQTVHSFFQQHGAP